MIDVITSFCCGSSAFYFTCVRVVSPIDDRHVSSHKFKNQKIRWFHHYRLYNIEDTWRHSRVPQVWKWVRLVRDAKAVLLKLCAVARWCVMISPQFLRYTLGYVVHRNQPHADNTALWYTLPTRSRVWYPGHPYKPANFIQYQFYSIFFKSQFYSISNIFPVNTKISTLN